jgi:phosphopantothenoylcysteine decarboxylase/phosphopantothenate--cysteine ligase
VGVCGGIAAYKMAIVVSRLVQRGDTVTVAMTSAAAEFVGHRTFEALSGQRVLTTAWTVIDDPASQHISLARRADAMLIAPCTMQTLARLAHGFADDAVSLLCAAIDRAQTPVLLAPAMNTDMLRQPAVVRNLRQLEDDGFTIVEPATGWQACRSEGPGRLPEPDVLIEAIDAALT